MINAGLDSLLQYSFKKEDHPKRWGLGVVASLINVNVIAIVSTNWRAGFASSGIRGRFFNLNVFKVLWDKKRLHGDACEDSTYSLSLGSGRWR
ncbi:hypothetical protein [Caldivirga sp.]|uniref:hypothetical protein n=1 Tax=Caldivirga sp. TaxID=2080243 RepID=UPI0025C64AAA|nr:hypothetical protein [Caldivirga sp.]